MTPAELRELATKLDTNLVCAERSGADLRAAAEALRISATLREAKKINWSKLSAMEVWLALKSAPKVAGPWTRPEGERQSSFRRLFTQVNTYDMPLACEVKYVDVVAVDAGHKTLYRWWTETTYVQRQGELIVGLEPAMKACDDALRAGGYVLVDDDGGGR